MIGTVVLGFVIGRQRGDDAISSVTTQRRDDFWAVVAFPANQCCGMTTVASSAQWITDQSVAGSPNTGWGVGNTVYARRTFDLSAFALSSVSMSFTWRVADDLVGIWLNGTQIQGAVNATWSQDQTLTLAAGSPLWILGNNVLELRGTSQNSTWDGFYVSGTATGQLGPNAVVPEPSTDALMATGFAGLALMRRRRVRQS